MKPKGGYWKLVGKQGRQAQANVKNLSAGTKKYGGKGYFYNCNKKIKYLGMHVHKCGGPKWAMWYLSMGKTPKDLDKKKIGLKLKQNIGRILILPI